MDRSSDSPYRSRPRQRKVAAVRPAWSGREITRAGAGRIPHFVVRPSYSIACGNGGVRAHFARSFSLSAARCSLLPLAATSLPLIGGCVRDRGSSAGVWFWAGLFAASLTAFFLLTRRLNATRDEAESPLPFDDAAKPSASDSPAPDSFGQNSAARASIPSSLDSSASEVLEDILVTACARRAAIRLRPSTEAASPFPVLSGLFSRLASCLPRCRRTKSRQSDPEFDLTLHGLCVDLDAARLIVRLQDALSSAEWPSWMGRSVEAWLALPADRFSVGQDAEFHFSARLQGAHFGERETLISLTRPRRMVSPCDSSSFNIQTPGVSRGR